MCARLHPPSAASQRGIALLTTILVMVLMSALLVGFTTAVMSDQSYRGIDRDRARAFYGAQSGIEKQNADLAKLFINQVGPTDAQVIALGAPANRPSIPNVNFVDVGASPAYQVTPLGPASNGIISSGPYEGLMALKRQFQLDATARAVDGGEVHLKRLVETVAIPVFQFGIFSDVDLSFSAAANFDFGGRVHTNANLFLAQSTVGSLILRDKVTAVGQIVRQRLSNGESIDASGSTGTVSMTRGNATGPYRTLARTEGSVTDGPTSSLNNSWPTISLSTYVGNIRNGRTGFRPLNLDLVTANGANIDLILRPPATEAVSSPIFAERYFKKVSLRVMLSDTPGDITSLPSVSPGAPILLDGNWRPGGAPPGGYGVVPVLAVPLPAGGPVPVARSGGPIINAPGGSANASVNASVTASTTNSANITMNPSIPDYFRLPANMQVVNALGGVQATINCTGKTPTTFTGCDDAASLSIPVALGATVRAVARTLDGHTISAPLAAQTIPAGSGTFTLTLSGTTAAAPTLPFSVNSFFIRDENTLVTCTGYNTTPQFTGCNVPVNLVVGDRIETGYLSNAGTGTIGGYLKVELQNNAGAWVDVTMEFLNYGISGPNSPGVGRPCDDPTPNAILRLQRMRDNNEPSTLAKCSYNGSTLSTDHWPNTLFDPREGVVRDLGTTGPSGHNGRVVLGGVMHYVELDVQNLSRWFNRTGAYAAGSGNLAMREGASPTGGFSVYFSDRRNNRNASNQETGEYGWEDVVNPADANGAPNGTLQTGEDFNGNGSLQTYGQFPNGGAGVYNSLPANPATLPAGVANPLASTARPWTFLGGGQAQVNRATHFRRALKLTKGSLGQIVAPGLTVAAENPVYVQGDWNASVAAGWGDPHVATSVAADSVTLLSNNWLDARSFGLNGDSPYDIANRPRSSDTRYRLAIISGKGPVFPRPSGAGATYGTDGGAHSFLRFIEGNSSGGNNRIWYRGSMVTFYYNRQNVHPFKCCNSMVYGVPVREYAFDIDFLDPVKLPPLTPMFRDLNALGFSQETRPGK